MKSNRKISFLIIGIIYILATGVGVFTYLALPLDLWLSLLIADVVATLFTFAFSVVLKNASVYDPYWSVQPIVIVASFAIDGASLSGVIVLTVIALWAIRLTYNWAYTFYGLDFQDWRYTMLCEKTGRLYPIVNLVGIHLVPTLIVYACTLPAVILVESRAELNPVSLIFTLLSLFAVGLQLFADRQMHAYRKNRQTTFIRTGLWKHSRHPNYLGEILMWYGVGFYCVINMPSAWYLIIGAILNNALFLLVSIPLADGRQSRKEGFAEYKKETHMLIPIKKIRR